MLISCKYRAFNSRKRSGSREKSRRRKVQFHRETTTTKRRRIYSVLCVTCQRKERIYLNDDLLENEDRESLVQGYLHGVFDVISFHVVKSIKRKRERGREREGSSAMLSELDKPKKDRQTDRLYVWDNKKEKENQMKLIRPLPLRVKSFSRSRSRSQSIEIRRKRKATYSNDRREIVVVDAEDCDSSSRDGCCCRSVNSSELE